MMNEPVEVAFDLEAEIREIAAACRVPEAKARPAAQLLAEGNTIPFIARYRKERTGGLDEAALRAIEDAIQYFRELAERKTTVLKTIHEQGKLDETLRKRILACRDKKELEELYLPYKPKRRTRATIARQRGLEPLAAFLKRQVNPGVGREEVLRPYVSPDQDVPDGEAALRGACDIVAEDWADDVEVRSLVREAMKQGMLASGVRRDWAGKPSKFEMYYDHREPLAKVPSHRYLAMRRGEAEEVLRVGIEIDQEAVIRRLSGRLVTNPSFLFRRELLDTVADCCRAAPFSFRGSGPAGRDEGHRRRGGDPGLLAEPPRAAPFAAGRAAGRDGHRPGVPHRLQGRGGRRHGQVPGARDDLSHSAPQQDRGSGRRSSSRSWTGTAWS